MEEWEWRSESGGVGGRYIDTDHKLEEYLTE